MGAEYKEMFTMDCKRRGSMNKTGIEGYSKRREISGDCVSDKSWPIETAVRTWAQCERQEAKIIAKMGKRQCRSFAVMERTNFLPPSLSHSHTHTYMHTHTPLPGGSIPGDMWDAVLAAVSVREMWHPGWPRNMSWSCTKNELLNSEEETTICSNSWTSSPTFDFPLVFGRTGA